MGIPKTGIQACKYSDKEIMRMLRYKAKFWEKNVDNGSVTSKYRLVRNYGTKISFPSGKKPEEMFGI